MRVGIFGASGFVGGSVSRHLMAKGHTVQAFAAPRLLHSATSVEDLLEHASATVGGLSLDLDGLDAVINCAGLAAATSTQRAELLGANALLPNVLAFAADRQSVPRFVHISSAAVQGSAATLDESSDLNPSSPYGESKALGEVALLRLRSGTVRILRPTSVQGPGRHVTRQLMRLAASKFAAVASPGLDPTPQVHIDNVARAVELIADTSVESPAISLQPWEGFTTASFLRTLAPDNSPRLLPRRLASTAVRVARKTAAAAPSVAGYSRRIEMLLFGQRQAEGWLAEADPDLTRPNEGWATLVTESNGTRC